jgi:hypothetical protein
VKRDNVSKPFLREGKGRKKSSLDDGAPGMDKDKKRKEKGRRKTYV